MYIFLFVISVSCRHFSGVFAKWEFASVFMTCVS